VAQTYTLSLPPELDEDLTKVADQLHISKADALQRAIVLMRHAAEADKVEITHQDVKQEVSVR
jgi:hypothetical protein